jgi:cation/acetate symporter
MTLNYSTPAVNPRLGSSFAIFASSYVSLTLVLIVLEQLGLSAPSIDELIVLTPLGFYCAIAFMTRTINVDEFFLAGQRVPPFYSAIALCGAVFGGSILLGSIGSLFLIGIDAIAIPLGCFAGLILMGFLFVPHLRKAGANTLPGFIYLRFGTTGLRGAAALVALAPCLMILVAEIAVGGKLTAYFLPLPQTLGLNLAPSLFYPLLLFGSIFITAALGGMRSATWTQCAQFVVFLGILAPLVVVSIIRTNLPLPQLTYGSQLEEIKSREAAKGLVTVAQPQPLSESLPRVAPQSVVRPVERMFSAFRPLDFVLLVLCLAAGVAAHPALIPKLSMTPTILSTRRTFGWVAVLAGFVILTIPAYALFTKAMATEALLGVALPDLPTWSQLLKQLGLVTIPANQFDTIGTAQRVLFQRDSLAFVLPVAGGLPRVFFGLAAAAALAALSACASAQLAAIGTIVSDDLYFGTLNKGASPARRLLIARLFMLLCGLAVLVILQKGAPDPLRWVIAALSLSAGSLFAVLFLSVWWRRFTSKGALAATLLGFLVTSFYLSRGGTHFLGGDALTAGAAGMVAAFGAAVAVSLFTGEPSEQALEAVDELRIPAGETVQARMLRLAARTKPARP